MNRLAFLPRSLQHAALGFRDHLRTQRQRRLLQGLSHRAVRRIIVGAGPTAYEGWVGTDRSTLDLLVPESWARYMEPNSLDAILAEHVWEHLTPDQAVVAARTCALFLKPGGYLRVAVPDGRHPDPAYIEQVRPGGTGAGADDHQVLYTHETFTAVFAAAGLEPRLLEYFDADGLFQSKDWDPALGMIRRSRRFDPRNSERLAYTSIVVDAIKQS